MVVDLCIMPYGMPLIREIHFVHRRVYNYSLREIHFVHCAVLFSRFTTSTGSILPKKKYRRYNATRVYTHVLNRKKKLRIVVRYNFTVASKTLQIANQINRRVVQI